MGNPSGTQVYDLQKNLDLSKRGPYAAPPQPGKMQPHAWWWNAPAASMKLAGGVVAKGMRFVVVAASLASTTGEMPPPWAASASSEVAAPGSDVNAFDHPAPIRWLHVPKVGSPFVRTACVYGCSRGNRDVPNSQLETELRGFVDENVHDGYCELRFCPRQWQERNGGNCDGGVIKNPGHFPIAPAEVGRVVALFRHPRSRVASSCRQFAKPGFTDDWYARCMSDHFVHHSAVQTRLVAGESCGGSLGCNSANYLPPVRTEWVHKALERIVHGAFAFIGLTDAWDASIELFHTQLTPGVAVLPSELKLGHQSAGSNSSHKDTLLRQERAAGLVYGNSTPRATRDAAELDPDLLVYAAARIFFCRDYSNRVGSASPEECKAALGPSPAGPQQVLAARVVAHWSAAQALVPAVAGLACGARGGRSGP